MANYSNKATKISQKAPKIRPFEANDILSYFNVFVIISQCQSLVKLIFPIFLYLLYYSLKKRV